MINTTNSAASQEQSQETQMQQQHQEDRKTEYEKQNEILTTNVSIPEERKQQEFKISITTGKPIPENTDDISVLAYPRIFPHGDGDIFEKKVKNKVSGTARSKLRKLLLKATKFNKKLRFVYQEH